MFVRVCCIGRGCGCIIPSSSSCPICGMQMTKQGRTTYTNTGKCSQFNDTRASHNIRRLYQFFTVLMYCVIPYAMSNLSKTSLYLPQGQSEGESGLRQVLILNGKVPFLLPVIIQILYLIIYTWMKLDFALTIVQKLAIEAKG